VSSGKTGLSQSSLTGVSSRQHPAGVRAVRRRDEQQQLPFGRPFAAFPHDHAAIRLVGNSSPIGRQSRVDRIAPSVPVGAAVSCYLASSPKPASLSEWVRGFEIAKYLLNLPARACGLTAGWRRSRRPAGRRINQNRELGCLTCFVLAKSDGLDSLVVYLEILSQVFTHHLCAGRC
jgi:hypothetical protein